MKTIFYLVRHGESLHNAKNIVQGKRIDIDNTLSLSGIKQAQEAAKILSSIHFDACYSSPSLRAYETAKIITKKRNIKTLVEDRLREKNQGSMTGMNKADLKNLYPNWGQMSEDENLDFKAVPDEESQRELRNRALDVLKIIAANHVGQNILIATHNGFMRSVYNYATGTSFKRNFKFLNCGIMELEFYDSTFKVVKTERLKELTTSEFFGITK